MKKLILSSLLIIVCFSLKAQIKVQLEATTGYFLDSNNVKKVFIGDDKITISNYYDQSGIFDADYDGIKCFVFYSDIIPTPEYNRYANRIAKQLTKDADAKDKYIIAFGKYWGKLVKANILEFGMTEQMVRCELGSPKNVTTTSDEYGTVTVWTYFLYDNKIKMIYFTNGKVSTISE